MLTTKKINICGVNFDNISRSKLRNILRERLKGSAQNYFIVTPNVDFIVRDNSDINFRNILNRADLSLCDSAIVRNAGFFLGKNIKEKITGWDLLELICANLGMESNCFILGATQEVVKISTNKLEQFYPDVRIVGFHHGYFEKNEDGEIVTMINSANTDILIVAMGSPRQELWVDENKKFLKTKIIICVGGIIDLLAGKAKRAPVWMQGIGLEWFWRLIKEPKRLWKRYLIDDMKFFYLLLKDWAGK